MELHVIRHAETEMNRKDMIIGRLDPPIAETESPILDRLDSDYDVIYSSDLLRARQTSELISHILKIPVVFSESLREIDYGRLSGMEKSKAAEKNPRYHLDVDYVNPGGESFSDMHNRITAFISSIKGKHDKVLIVTHSGCIRSIYSHCTGQSLQDNINMRVTHENILKCELLTGSAKFH